MTKVQAKKAVWIRNKNGYYQSKEDFFEKNSISNENIENINEVICL